MRESTRHPAKECGAGAEMLFQGALALSFIEGCMSVLKANIKQKRADIKSASPDT